ncbi:MAG TPA: apolipoprotein N-acyltransferase, partial [Gammaproteobacteria bacterium]|nr:apolipoprotein N-acyltransferase [Gammaproteobacteria bacterium]
MVLFVAGALLVLAFAPFGFWWIAPLSMAVLFYFWLHAASPRQAFKQGFYFGLGQFGAGIWWIFISFNTFGQAPLWLSLPMVGGLMAVMALFPASSGWLSKKIAPQLGGVSVLLLVYPAAWTLLEWIRGWFLTGFPWLALGYTQTDTWLAGLAPIGGVFLVSLAVA